MLKPNVLMVDDRPDNLLALHAILDSSDYTLTDCSSGKEALAKSLQEKFDLILMDVQMPDLNGFETAKLLKSRPKTGSTPLIFLSSYDVSEIPAIETNMLCGGVDYVTKPFDAKTLKRKVEFFLRYAESEQLGSKASESEYLKFLSIFNELIDPLGAVLLNVQMLKKKFLNQERQIELQTLSRKLEFLEGSTRRLKNIIMDFRNGERLSRFRV